MRDIKFRAWKRVNTPEMFNDVQAIDFKSGIAHLGYKLSSSSVRTDKESLDNLILMQYTGLKDKNGKEVYEGDAVSSIYAHQKDYGYVDLVDGAFCLIITSGKTSRPREKYFLSTCKELEVIGNIYEKPELLEVPK